VSRPWLASSTSTAAGSGTLASLRHGDSRKRSEWTEGRGGVGGRLGDSLGRPHQPQGAAAGGSEEGGGAEDGHRVGWGGEEVERGRLL
jgi:hypothetical protein